ncbi:uncharacterized protein BYT42DRAFT_575841 [Radiomyces spectabilis]|uniref:uncharacterized protein n=1 Tax=Radiomyces spectabilis TaxID=64574 RepID=UPI0022208B1F|nr:uncharacterized protein BYT42DRAFT_575841 [Radiomyces spectabilis]KAI8374290.1 hypothetical protein BYT42DRAFT_575841 [Radiomyces spectabilis]
MNKKQTSHGWIHQCLDFWMDHWANNTKEPSQQGTAERVVITCWTNLNVLDHIFCEKCITAYMDQRSTCPVCQTPIERSSFQPSKFVKRQIGRLRARCIHQSLGCNWQGLFGDEHIEQCQYVPVPCPNAERGCAEKPPQKDMEQHVAQCPFALIRCPNLDPLCTPFLRKDMEAHEKRCRSYPCRYAMEGCSFLGTLPETKAHCELYCGKLHARIQMLESECEQLKKLCIEHGIDQGKLEAVRLSSSVHASNNNSTPTTNTVEGSQTNNNNNNNALMNEMLLFHQMFNQDPYLPLLLSNDNNNNSNNNSNNNTNNSNPHNNTSNHHQPSHSTAQSNNTTDAAKSGNDPTSAFLGKLDFMDVTDCLSGDATFPSLLPPAPSFITPTTNTSVNAAVNTTTTNNVPPKASMSDTTAIHTTAVPKRSSNGKIIRYSKNKRLAHSALRMARQKVVQDILGSPEMMLQDLDVAKTGMSLDTSSPLVSSLLSSSSSNDTSSTIDLSTLMSQQSISSPPSHSFPFNNLEDMTKFLAELPSDAGVSSNDHPPTALMGGRGDASPSNGPPRPSPPGKPDRKKKTSPQKKKKAPSSKPTDQVVTASSPTPATNAPSPSSGAAPKKRPMFVLASTYLSNYK